MAKLARVFGIVAAAKVVAIGAIYLSGCTRRLGATRAEAALPVPGDELIGRPAIQADRAITIDAPPDQVWPWLAQLGQDKGGFYSYTWLENLAGCEIQNADRIVPAWQHPQTGDPFPLHPELILTLARVEPGRALVAASPGTTDPKLAATGMEFTWAFVVRADPDATGTAPRTRLHVRERYQATGAGMRAAVEAMNLVSTLMSWKMLRSVKQLAERPEEPGWISRDGTS